MRSVMSGTWRGYSANRRRTDPGAARIGRAGEGHGHGAKLILLGEVAERTEMIDIRCWHCDRQGHYRTARLVEQHGANFAIANLLDLVTADCRKRIQPNWYDRCSPYCPDLPRLFPPRPRVLERG